MFLAVFEILVAAQHLKKTSGSLCPWPGIQGRGPWLTMLGGLVAPPLELQILPLSWCCPGPSCISSDIYCRDPEALPADLIGIPPKLCHALSVRLIHCDIKPRRWTRDA